jgi:hypothetical protein
MVLDAEDASSWMPILVTTYAIREDFSRIRQEEPEKDAFGQTFQQ